MSAADEVNKGSVADSDPTHLLGRCLAQSCVTQIQTSSLPLLATRRRPLNTSADWSITSDVEPLRDLDRVIDVDAEIAPRAEIAIKPVALYIAHVGSIGCIQRTIESLDFI